MYIVTMSTVRFFGVYNSHTIAGRDHKGSGKDINLFHMKNVHFLDV